VSSAAVRRRVDEIARRCYTGLDALALGAEALRRLRAVMPIDAAFFATTDPSTVLFTSVLTEEPLAAAAAQFLENEIGGEDVNRFTALARREGVNSLDRVTGGRRADSARYTEVMAPLQLGDELRAALVSRGRCWGVVCLHREEGASGFGAAELELLRRLAPHLGEGLRRAVVVHAATSDTSANGPGVVLLDADLSVTSMNAQAEEWFAQLDGRDVVATPGGPLPIAVFAAAVHAAHGGDEGVPATTRIRTSTGHWLSVHASALGGPGQQTAVVLEPARPLDLASLFLDARGLTPAQSRVAALVLQGLSTREIVNELQISSYTVQEHLRAVFDAFGIGSRRELVATLLGQRA
jgi:DNA-binding CsgD family transcriptional regulator